MSESFKTKLIRWGFNFFPAYRATGGRITYIAEDFREVRVRLPLNGKTRNIVGTLYGGSMYAAVDPIYMVMLMRNLGPDFVVWDKAASIRFKKPGRSTLYARFELDAGELDAIRTGLKHAASIDRQYSVVLADAQGIPHALIEKVLYIRRKSAADSNR